MYIRNGEEPHMMHTPVAVSSLFPVLPHTTLPFFALRNTHDTHNTRCRVAGPISLLFSSLHIHTHNSFDIHNETYTDFHRPLESVFAGPVVFPDELVVV